MSLTLIGKAAGTVTAVIQQTFEYTADENLPARSVVAKDESGLGVLQAQANGWSRMPAIGVTQNAASLGDVVEVYQFGQVTGVRRDGDFSPDDQIFVSPLNAGQATNVPPDSVGDLIQTIGRALNSSDITLSVWSIVMELEQT